MRGRDFLSLSDFEPDELRLILDSAERLKRAQRDREPHRLLSERSLAMVFERPSLRTRTTFTVGMTQLGGHAIDLMDEHMQIGVRESVPDIARNLERWVDVVAARVHKHATAEQLAAHASVPVINALSDRYHPCQVLADLLTIREHLGGLEGRVLAFVGDGFNVCHSLMLGAGLAGMHVRVATPAGFEPMAAVTARSLDLAKAAGGSVEVGRDPIAAVRGADAVYTDSWVSMGLEEEAAERSRVFPPFQVNGALMAEAASHAIFLHCLPAHRGEEVTDEVMDGPHSAVFDQAENRLHAQKALLVLLLRGAEALRELPTQPQTRR